LDSESKRRI
jgi:hypothetical protein